MKKISELVKAGISEEAVKKSVGEEVNKKFDEFIRQSIGG